MSELICPYKAVALKLTSLGMVDRLLLLAKLDKADRTKVRKQLKPLKHLTKQEASELYQNISQSDDKVPLTLTAKGDVEQNIFSPSVVALIADIKAGNSHLPKALADALLSEYQLLLEGKSKHD